MINQKVLTYAHIKLSNVIQRFNIKFLSIHTYIAINLYSNTFTHLTFDPEIQHSHLKVQLFAKLPHANERISSYTQSMQSFVNYLIYYSKKWHDFAIFSYKILGHTCYDLLMSNLQDVYESTDAFHHTYRRMLKCKIFLVENVLKIYYYNLIFFEVQ